MKSFSPVAACLIGCAAAFPHIDRLTASFAAGDLESASLRARAIASPPQGAGALPLVPPPFDAASQYVSTTGQYAVSSDPETVFVLYTF